MTSPTSSSPPADPQPADLPAARRDWETRVLGGGEEPDPRFTLANERTFLAWTRTSLAFLAGGIALAAFPLEQISDEIRTLTAIFVVGIGLLISGGAAMRWLRVERAMRHKRPLPIPAIVPLLSVAAVCACVLTIVMLF